MILLENVSKSFKNGVHALRDVNLYIEEGEFVYIIGPTGSGKSTLIKLLDGELVPTRGRVVVADTDVGKLRHSKVPLYRRNIGVVFQDFRLLPELTVFENIAFALQVIGLDKVTIRRRVREILELVSLEDKAKSFPRELSGGQQQRVAIGRALITRPKLILADEPTGNLDSRNSQEVLDLLVKASRQYQQTILMITHNNALAASTDKVLRVTDGCLYDDCQSNPKNTTGKGASYRDEKLS